MTLKGFRIERFADFKVLASQSSSPKFLDTTHNLAFFYMKKRIEYEVQDSRESDELIKLGFIPGSEVDVLELL